MKREEVCAGLWRLSNETPPPPGWQKPFFYLLGFKNLVLIDAGYKESNTIEKIKEVIISSSCRLKAVLLTHGHTDHAGAIQELKNNFHPKIIAHSQEFAILKRRDLHTAVDQWLDGDFELDTELGTLRAVFTPGHSPGHICFWLKKERLLFTGDLVVGEGTSFVGPPDGDMSNYMNSLEKVQTFNPKLILPGHGPLVNAPQKHLKELIEHRLLREYQILKILSQSSCTIKELVKQIYMGLIHPALYPVAEITVLGHLNKLEKEGKVFQELSGEEKRYRLLE